VTSYNMKLENFLWPANLQTNLKPEKSSIIVLSRVLSDKLHCHYKCQLKTIFVFVSWLIPVAVQLVLCDFGNFWLLGMCKNEFLTNFKSLVKFVNFYEFYNGKSRILNLCPNCLQLYTKFGMYTCGQLVMFCVSVSLSYCLSACVARTIN